MPTDRTPPAPPSLRVVIAASSLGPVLVAAGDRGVSAILLGDTPDGLRAELRARFPDARLTPGDAALDALAAHVVAAVERPAGAAELPLDPQGTPFQQAVWAALREIPPGATATYAEVARRIGQPAAARAVARACAANPLAVVVPCHRVVRSDGTVAGYRWGVARKRLLLAREAAGAA